MIIIIIVIVIRHPQWGGARAAAPRPSLRARPEPRLPLRGALPLLVVVAAGVDVITVVIVW